MLGNVIVKIIIVSASAWVVSSFEVIALIHNVCLLLVLLSSSSSPSSSSQCIVLQPLLLFMRWLYLSLHINCVVITSFGVRCIRLSQILFGFKAKHTRTQYQPNEKNRCRKSKTHTHTWINGPKKLQQTRRRKG